MDHILDTIILVLPYKFHFIKKYVDDIILALPSTGINDILWYFNSYNPYIQFTLEREDATGSVPFLDTKLIRKGTHLLVDWYRKPISSGRYLNFWSYHKYSMKLNLVKEMKNRVLKISDTTFHTKNLKILYTLFIENSYPSTLLQKILFNTPQNSSSLLRNEENISLSQDMIGPVDPLPKQTAIRYVSLPYIKDICLKLSRIFSSIENIKIAFKTVLTVNKVFSKLKDQSSLLSLTDVVYCIPCGSCEQVYYGQTSRCLKDRMTSHKSDNRLHPERSALGEHAFKNGHRIDYNNIKVVEQESNITKRLFLEMAYICQDINAMNHRTDIGHLNEMFSYLLLLDKCNNNKTNNLSMDI
ncbi:uncharacterized protein LOC126889678 [Diabrotica virgifera virgifera]|uniref:Helix-turn-helix domain-containing protein n=1 Tax=Diabrotica virgifera virgifera TaxID=50390 RepID=A0ABM5KVD9_DIAVI|nr:uncharacterized protein LOC126889678 [Diabrotica virgifera virgifera]